MCGRPSALAPFDKATAHPYNTQQRPGAHVSVDYKSFKGGRMLSNRMAATDINDNDKLMAALAYILSPLVPIIILLVDSMKVRPYQKYHAVQGLAVGVIVFVISILLSTFTVGIGCICVPILYIPLIYYTYIAYQGTYFDIPVVTNFMVQQGWLQRPGTPTM
jgi:uncharacterized membrane protein